MVVQTDDVARPGLFHVRAVARHKGQRVGDHHIFAGAHLTQLHAFFIFTGNHAHKGDAVAVFRVHVRLNLEHETGELLFLRGHGTHVGRARHRRGCPGDQPTEHMIDAEVTQRGAEKDRRDIAAQEQLAIELVRRAFNQLQLFAQLRRQLFADRAVQLRIIQPFDDAHFLNGVAFTRLVEIGFVVIEVVNAFEQLAASDRPGNGRAGDFQLALHFVQQFHRIADVAIELVHKGQDRRVAQTGDFHQLTGTILDAFGRVDHHQAAVYRRQSTVGIFREVFVPRRVEQVDQALAVGELHNRSSNRDAALLLHLHPVRFGVLARAAAFYRTGGLDSLSEQQHFFSDGGFTGIGVRNDRKGAAARHLLHEIRHE